MLWGGPSQAGGLATTALATGAVGRAGGSKKLIGAWYGDGSLGEYLSRSCHRELGKHARAAPYGPMLEVGGHGHRPWLSVGDRCRRVVRARRGHGRDVTRPAAVGAIEWLGGPGGGAGPSEQRIRRRST